MSMVTLVDVLIPLPIARFIFLRLANKAGLGLVSMLIRRLADVLHPYLLL